MENFQTGAIDGSKISIIRGLEPSCPQLAGGEGVGVVVYVAKVIFRLNVLELDGVGCSLLQGFAGLQGQDLGRVVVTEVVQADCRSNLERVSEDQGVVVQRTVEADLNLCGPTY